MRDATTLVHLEALLVSLRDQLDHLTERVDARLADQELQLKRLRRELSRLQGNAAPLRVDRQGGALPLLIARR